ncbi:MAG: (2Fe-2S)-binding protein [Acidothermus cellulolyticus]|nr:(2Fe-2S)-binding protein [Acidothermus cellulolyticus]
MTEHVTFVVNGVERTVTGSPDVPLLYVLRNDLGLMAAKFGCGMGLCGTCTVLLDGRPVHSCDTPLWAAAGKTVVTLEGILDEPVGAALERGFLDHQALQCGYCTAGMMVTAAALLREKPNADEDAVRAALSRNLCRCGAHQRIVAAIRSAAQQLANSASAGNPAEDGQ